jgi:hypothetical protein
MVVALLTTIVSVPSKLELYENRASRKRHHPRLRVRVSSMQIYIVMARGLVDEMRRHFVAMILPYFRDLITLLGGASESCWRYAITVAKGDPRSMISPCWSIMLSISFKLFLGIILRLICRGCFFASYLTL